MVLLIVSEVSATHCADIDAIEIVCLNGHFLLPCYGHSDYNLCYVV